MSSTAFRLRGREVSRIEGFTDAVFAFAVTLLVVSLEVPRTFTELAETMRDFPAFAICFAVLFAVWYRHHTFFRRYALQDVTTAALTGVLLFVVLFYVYPLKFLFTLLLGQVLGLGRHVAGEAPIETEQVPALFIVYGAGLIAVETTFTLLYAHAYRRRAELDLSPREVFLTRSAMGRNLVSAAVGALSILIALAHGAIPLSWAGWVYFLNAPAHALFGSLVGRRWRRLEAGAA
jgi:uncharacterized membrane protein